MLPPKYSPAPWACPLRRRGSRPSRQMSLMLASGVPWNTSRIVLFGTLPQAATKRSYREQPGRLRGLSQTSSCMERPGRARRPGMLNLGAACRISSEICARWSSSRSSGSASTSMASAIMRARSRRACRRRSRAACSEARSVLGAWRSDACSDLAMHASSPSRSITAGPDGAPVPASSMLRSMKRELPDSPEPSLAPAEAAAGAPAAPCEAGPDTLELNPLPTGTSRPESCESQVRSRAMAAPARVPRRGLRADWPLGSRLTSKDRCRTCLYELSSGDEVRSITTEVEAMSVGGRPGGPRGPGAKCGRGSMY
mmetsp:Transcript_12203/g.40105  ORF Transcript_12203/g.40105 Transcript_12203/m.40105 type:complete len:312 (+) Transcript_12203:429-1364(+)